jgi:hypothetical protein
MTLTPFLTNAALDDEKSALRQRNTEINVFHMTTVLYLGCWWQCNEYEQ